MPKSKCQGCEKWVTSPELRRCRDGGLRCVDCYVKNLGVEVGARPTERAVDSDSEFNGAASQNHSPDMDDFFREVEDMDVSTHSPEARVETPESTQNSLVSSGVSMSSSASIGTEANSGVIFLPDIATVINTQRMCFVCRRSDQRQAVPKSACRQVWREKNVYVPQKNRCCSSHLDDDLFTMEAMRMIVSTSRGVYLSAEEIQEWILDLTNRDKDKPRVDFNTKNDVKDEEYRTLLPCSKVAFEEMLALIAPRMRNSSNRTKKNALAMFLMVLRLDLTQNFLGFLFRVDQQVVSEAIRTVSDLLLELHTPQHLGLGVTSRPEAVANSRVLFNELYGNHEAVIRVADGTYLDIEKPGSFEEQRKSFSPQKHKNLLKMMMIVYPSGRIEDVSGPFYADGGNNDATILKYLLACTPLPQHCEQGDILLLDRGFRDSRTQAEEVGLQVYMPHFLPNGQKQFTTKQANESRKLTSCRFVVEMANGRIKNVFPFFAGKIEAPYKKQMGKFFRIACGILNAYYPPLFKDSPDHQGQARRILDRMDMRNLLQARIEDMGFDNTIRSRLWQAADQSSVPDFPRLTLEDIKELTGGVFQINMAKRYTDQHLDDQGDYQIYLHQEADKLIRCQLHSRFSGQTKHNTWVEYSTDHEGIRNVVGYYCTCKSGARVVGTCSHVTCVIRYLGHDRHQPPGIRRVIARASILDAAAELARHENE